MSQTRSNSPTFSQVAQDYLRVGAARGASSGELVEDEFTTRGDVLHHPLDPCGVARPQYIGHAYERPYVVRWATSIDRRSPRVFGVLTTRNRVSSTPGLEKR